MPGIDKYEILKDYCDWGWRLLPVNSSNKKAILKGWVENATCDHQTIEHWCKHAYPRANWGIVCGKESGIIVIDLDEPKPDKDGNITDIHGEIALPQLEQELGELPVTVSQTTPGKGRHLFFKAPQDVTIHVKKGIRFFPGMAIDILSEKRQVIVSPSRRPDGDYEWIKGLSPWDIELAELPPRWIERLSATSKKTRTKKDNVIALSPLSSDKFSLPDVIGNGERNDTLFKYACSLLAKGEDHDRVRELVLQADAERGNPPMQDDPDDYHELLNTIESAINTDVAGREARIVETLEAAGIAVDNNQVKESLDWLIVNVKKDGTTTYDIDERNFSYWFVEKHGLVNIHGMIYSIETGEFLNDMLVSQYIQNEIEPYIRKNMDARVKSLFNLCKRRAYTEFDMPDEFKMVFQNKAFEMGRDGRLTEVPHEKTLFSFPVEYDPAAKCPKWENFIAGLIPAYAIRTIQQYMGYCLIPSKRAQVALFIIGNGGEGKSVVLDVLAALLGSHNIVKGRLHRIFNPEQRFQTAQLINRYVCIDDDMQTSPLKETGDFKSWITDSVTSVEPKGIDPYQVRQFVKFISAGNKMLTAQYDRTDGWYRRLVQINVLPVPKDRVKNRFLTDELLEELPGILNWCLEGLSDFMKNGCELYQSEETQNLTQEEKRDNDSLETFLAECDLITIDGESECTSTELWKIYNHWAFVNGYHTFANASSFSKQLKPKLTHRGITTEDNARSADGKRGRGYKGILIHHEKKDYLNGKILTLR